jgi:methylmalonyl-CoA mutase cobalamin-binding domain/chain
MTVSEDAEARADRAAQGLARLARRQGGRRDAGRIEARRRDRRQYHAALDRLRQSRRHHRRMGLDAARGFWRIPRADRRRQCHAQRRRWADDIRGEVDRVSRKLGRRLTFLVGKPGLDGHSNGAEQIAVRARDAGMEVVYEGIRLTPEEIVDAAQEKRAHVVGLSILSGSHMPLVADVVARMKEAGIDDIPVVVGGIIPPEDAAAMEKSGVAAVYTPKDFELNRIMSDVVRIVERANGVSNV